VLLVFAFSRLFFSLVGTLAALLVPWVSPGGVLAPPGLLHYWAHWDGAWYSAIATYGYGFREPESTTFFPLYPMLVRAGNIVIGGGPYLWGVFVSLTATLFALYFLYQIAEKLLNPRAARATTLAFAFFPTAFFLNAVYTEALFLAFATGSVWAVYVRRDLLLAGVLGALAAATRNFGVLLLIPLGYEWLRNRREFGWRGALGVGIVPAGFLGYTLFLWYRFGDPLIFARQQSAHWNRELTNPLTTLKEAWTSAGEGLKYVLDPASLFLTRAPDPALEASNTLNIAFLLLFLVLVGIGFAVLPPGLSAYALLFTLLPMLTPSPLFPLMSLPRFMLGAFPLFFVLGYLLSRNRPALYLWLLVSGGLSAALTAMFVTWRWVA
jgi:mannosyltransferase PIG-V